MARIEKIDLRMVDLPPKVKRTDAIQSFVSQETPIVRITGVFETGRRKSTLLMSSGCASITHAKQL